jgi:hypothetical protein
MPNRRERAFDPPGLRGSKSSRRQPHEIVEPIWESPCLPVTALMVATTDRQLRILESRKKICAPAKLDDDLCFYSPQENVEALEHPRIRRWLRFVAEEYAPKIDPKCRAILLLLPCTKTKPYPLSPEHLRVNRSLIEAGFHSVEGATLADAFSAHLPAGYSPEVLSLQPLRRGNLALHRAVVSEPLVFVPYEHVFLWENRPSPACAYDDPGLFEGRGNAVAPWRSDFTGVSVSRTRWRWGEQERRAYVTMHNEMSRQLAHVVDRLRSHYQDVIAWVAPGLTHRSFILERGERNAHKISASRRVGGENLPLKGANDFLSREARIECLPTREQCETAKRRLAERLGRPLSAIGGYYSRGGGDATPLALPELIEFLLSRLKQNQV